MTTAHPPGSRPPAPSRWGLPLFLALALVGSYGTIMTDAPGWWIFTIAMVIFALVSWIDVRAWRRMRDRGELRGPGESDDPANGTSS